MEKVAYDLTEVIESMKDVSCICDNNIRSNYKTIPEGNRGNLTYSTGRFCVAFPMDSVHGNRVRICYRVWKEIISDAFKRYEYIGKGIKRAHLAYFSGFRFIREALKMKCDQRIVPGMVMDWIEGETLDKFLRERWGKLSKLSRLTFIRDFYHMCDELHTAGIAHGDLSCVNIMVTATNEIRLVDYDSLYVSEMETKFEQVTGGADGFQHPDRINSKSPLCASIDDDNFSQLVIALSLWVAYFEASEIETSEIETSKNKTSKNKTSITQRYGDSNLLFLSSDLSGKDGDERVRNLRNSMGWKAAQEYSSRFEHVRTLMNALKSSIQNPVSKVPSLLRFASRKAIQSDPKLFYSLLVQEKASYCTACGHKFISDDFDYCTICGAKRHVYEVA